MEAAKKRYFLSNPATKAFSPPPWLSGHRNFFPYIKKKFFFLSGTPLLVALPLRKELFFAASLREMSGLVFLILFSRLIHLLALVNRLLQTIDLTAGLQCDAI